MQAYNDWMIDEWCAGDGKGRLIPLTMIPLWDAELAAAEVRRCADKGSHAVDLLREPAPARPAVGAHTGYWDPFFQACEETDTVVCMHIGSSSKMPVDVARRAVHRVSSTLTFPNAMGSMLDYIFSGTLERFPNLRIAYSEGQVGWMPYVLERADKLWAERGRRTASARRCRTRPAQLHPGPRSTAASSTTRSACRTATSSAWTRSRFEIDYPHADCTFPHTKEVAERICGKAGLNDDEIYRFFRGNAIDLYKLGEYFGISE